jgi:serine protease AprX
MRKILVFFLLFLIANGFSQEDAWVYFTNKPNASYFLANPLEMLSQKALNRRTAQAIPLDIVDVPIHQPYILQVAGNSGITVLAKSKWLNAVHVRGTQANIEALDTISFVSHIHFANSSLNGSTSGRMSQIYAEAKNLDTQVVFQYGNSANQVNMMNGHLLHQNNYTGTDKIIAVMDNGFVGVNSTVPFQRLFTNNLILGGYNFVTQSDAIYTGGSHGTMVLSTMGGYVENELIGSAPDAKYYLFVTESNTYENPLEESLWVEAAEMADSLGVDVINTSLGYAAFDNPAYNYTYAAMNGTTTFIAKGAAIAFSRGMICVTSAGNSGTTTWQYITTPGDALNTLTVGAVNASGVYASFSSIGPSADNRIKPDVVAQGVGATVATASGSIGVANGTSFSSPITAGLVACLWQSLPNLTNAEILQLVKQSASIYATPTAQLGYGIPNFYAAFQAGQLLSNDEVTTKSFSVYPNPFDEQLKIQWSEMNSIGELQLYNATGQLILQSKINSNQTLSVAHLKPGMYFYLLQSDGLMKSGKIIKK